MDTGALLLPTSRDIALLSDRAQPEKDVLPCWTLGSHLHNNIPDSNDSCVLPAITRAKRLHGAIITCSFKNYSDIGVNGKLPTHK